MNDEIRAEMSMLEGDAALMPLGTPDFYCEPGERWECPCGGLKSGPISGTPGMCLYQQCPTCKRVVGMRS